MHVDNLKDIYGCVAKFFDTKIDQEKLTLAPRFCDCVELSTSESHKNIKYIFSSKSCIRGHSADKINNMKPTVFVRLVRSLPHPIKSPSVIFITDVQVWV